MTCTEFFRPRPWLATGALAVVLGLTGCASYIGKRIVEPPNQGRSQLVFPESLEHFWTEVVEKHYIVERFEVPSPFDDIRLVTFLLPAGDYPHEYTFEMDESGSAKLNFHLHSASGPNPPAVGSVLYLHGWQSSYRQMFFHALALADHGWDGYLADLRGHGQSDGDYTSFGIREAEDVRQTIKHIRQTPDFTEPLVVVGASLGGAVALMASADNPDADAVVALAPYAEFKLILPNGIKVMAPGYMRPWLGEKKVRKALRFAEKTAGINLDEAAPILSAGAVNQPVLLIHGADDRFVPLIHSQRLDDAMPHSQLAQIENRGHIPLMLDRDAVLNVMIPWLETLGESSLESAGTETVQSPK